MRRLFDTVRPEGPTPIGEKLENLLLYYMDNLEKAKARADEGDHSLMRMIKPVNYIIITDGAPSKPQLPTAKSDESQRRNFILADDPEAVIVTTARRLDSHNFPLTQVSGVMHADGSVLTAVSLLP